MKQIKKNFKKFKKKATTAITQARAFVPQKAPKA